MLIICDSNRLIFLLFSPSPSWHKCSPVHCGCRAQLFTHRGDFTDWSLQMVLRKVRYDRPQSITCNLVDYLHIHIDYEAVPSPSYSVITLWLLIRSCIIDRSPLTGIKVHSCCLIHHNSWRSHHSVDHLPPTLATGINICPQVHFTQGTFYKMNSESLLEHKRA